MSGGATVGEPAAAAAMQFEAPRRAMFLGHDLSIAGEVLVPRAETELLGRRAIQLLRSHGDETPIVVDMCCGSGNLAVAIALAVSAARVVAADVTDAAVATARHNVQALGLRDRVTVCQGDLFEALAAEALEGRLAMVVCNPPYISTARLEGESAHLLDGEPREAFDGGPYGIAIHQRLVREAPRFLRAGGHLLFEFGLGQQRQAAALLSRARVYDSIEFVEDAAGEPRVALARIKPA